jgi:hypothetical protein
LISAAILVDYQVMEDEDGNCTKCTHAFGRHVLMATMISPEHGGLIFCDRLGCLCQSTWSLEDEPMPYIPDEGEIAQLRALAQSPDEPESGDDDWHPDSDIDIWLD